MQVNQNQNQRFNGRRCSYCHVEGHNISTCNHNSIHRFKRTCFGNRLIFDVENLSNSVDRSRQRFKEWLFGIIGEDPQLVLVFASRFCRIPAHIDFIDRAEGITRYVYYCEPDNASRIANPGGDNLINLALTNVRVFNGMLFDERIEYINRVTTYLNAVQNTPQKYNIHVTVSSRYSSHQQENPEKEEQEQEKMECSICYEEKSLNICMDLNCRHKFCGDCVISTLKTTKQIIPSCSLCREPVKHITLYDADMFNKINPYITNMDS